VVAAPLLVVLVVLPLPLLVVLLYLSSLFLRVQWT
jgi:hypothetical protein